MRIRAGALFKGTPGAWYTPGRPRSGARLLPLQDLPAAAEENSRAARTPRQVRLLPGGGECLIRGIPGPPLRCRV
ncbi:hypothetical protein NDU88_005231 [Pleurodeles waltl]|uniref:Uncharacterized protein n=1 Tax=Pleurodeles waltl TaxID=8319 RepID=A0AAV7LNY7_PLEWA|nr:hypothetical protein NDU88_005231 [Pleurodeles waltl]